MNFIFRRDELLVRLDAGGFPDEEVCARLEVSLEPVWLEQGSPYRTAHVPPQLEAPDGYVFRKLRSLFGEFDDQRIALAGRAYQIAEWARTHRYCGACGAPMQRAAAEFCMRCPACGFSAYPRISPAMMVLVRRGDHILLARHAAVAATRYTALAGFVEPGEGIEEAVARELWEEAGVRVRNVRYVASQPWPFPSSLMIACTSEALSDELTLDTTEIEEAGWFSAAEVRAAMAGDESAPFIAPPPFAIAHDLLKHWLSQQ